TVPVRPGHLVTHVDCEFPGIELMVLDRHVATAAGGTARPGGDEHQRSGGQHTAGETRQDPAHENPLAPKTPRVTTDTFVLKHHRPHAGCAFHTGPVAFPRPVDSELGDELDGGSHAHPPPRPAVAPAAARAA